MEAAGYVTKAVLLERGWTPKMIKDHLGKPDAEGCVGSFWGYFYLTTKVDALEPSLNLGQVRRERAERVKSRDEKKKRLLQAAGSDGSILSDAIARARIAIEDFEEAVPVAQRFLACNFYVKPSYCTVVYFFQEHRADRALNPRIQRGAISPGCSEHNSRIHFKCTAKGIEAEWRKFEPFEHGQVSFQPENVQKCFEVMRKAGFIITAHEIAEAVRQAQEMEGE
jgi:hypothetical protein